MVNIQKNNKIRTSPHLSCYICQSPGKILYQGMTDRLFNVPGKWDIRQCQNPECGLLWLDPIPIKEDIGKVYLNYYTHGDINVVSKSFLRRAIDYIDKGYLADKYKYLKGQTGIYQRILGFLVYLDQGLKSELDFEVMYLPAQKGRLLDVGCGDGRFLMKMRDLGWQAEGMEVDETAVEIARKNGLKVSVGQLPGKTYPENFFDVITLRSVMEHFSDPLDVLIECQRILKDTGYLMIITPNTKSRVHNIYKEKWFDLDPPRHLHIFSSKNMKNLLKKAGFKNIKNWTTSRNLRSSLIGTWDIQKKGCHKMGGRQPLFIKIKAKFLQFFEEINLKIRPDSGDEIVLKVQKI